MLGMIVTGHGEFATGITSAIELLAGQQEFLVGVDFKSGDGEEDLQDHLKEAFARLENCSGIFILCDILGGSPFKNAVTLTLGNDKYRVIYGTKLGMAVELSMRCMMSGDDPVDMDALTQELVQIGQQQVGNYVFEPVVQEEEEDGI